MGQRPPRSAPPRQHPTTAGTRAGATSASGATGAPVAALAAGITDAAGATGATVAAKTLH